LWRQEQNPGSETNVRMKILGNKPRNIHPGKIINQENTCVGEQKLP